LKLIKINEADLTTIQATAGLIAWNIAFLNTFHYRNN